ncbi:MULTISPECIES: iron-containing redox enzyme family protein [Geodermatophilus]|uniref:Iron-containing redox enzyme family protein n=1 Tax=Geodermatophilus arenarius TaxID=1137990 RepID=A0ABV9LKX9_9ACTN
MLPLAVATSRRIVDHPGLHGVYPEFLVMWHGMIRASVPLMETALTAARALPDDPVAAPLADYLEHHIPEERGHDDWLLADLEAIGVPPDRVLARVPSPPVAALVGSQYYWVHHVHPVGLLGYIALLEGYPPARQDIDRMQAVSGYGPEAFRTLLLHAELDPHHGRELDDLLDALPLSGQQRTLIGLSGMASVQLLSLAQQELLDRF